MKKWFRDVAKVLKTATRTWRQIRKDSDDGDCVVADSPNVPSKYSLVWDTKYGMDHAVFSKMFTDGSTVVHSMQFPYVEVAMFIANVFCTNTGASINDITCMYEPEKEIDSYGDVITKITRGRLIFKEQVYNDFLVWLETYKDRFDNKDDWKTLLLPEIQDGQQVSGHFVNHNCEYQPRRSHPEHDDKFLNLPDDDIFDEWQWMLNNTSGKVRILHDKWVFEDASDAMMYQLQLR